ncbi:uncharacterized protein LOC126567183 [Anopheles maculipalpis]|uniref:uncharacterized protein LOC126567183 n=1 Tax=Anopheles maculipalpis TaxID=1496333 RepID=UPI0021593F8B|nr:uncharacterized protein LOC126567183 [Anopheles maculipalpis]
MESTFVSVFKLDGVPILPPLVNDEVRAAVAVYRSKAIEIEKRLQERNRTLAAIETVDSQSINGDSLTGRQALDEKENDSQEVVLSDEKKELETITNVSKIAIDTTSVDEDSLNQSEPSTITVPPGAEQKTIVITNTETKEKVDQADNVYNPIENSMKLDDVIHSSWQSSTTRTVTPTNSEESVGWFPLVRSNTFDLEKPTIDLVNLQRVNDHSTPVDRAKVKSPDESKEKKERSKIKTIPVESKPKALNSGVVTGKYNTPVKASPIAMGKSKAECLKKSPQDQRKLSTDPTKARPKRKTVSRKISHSSTGSGVESDRALESVAQALTTHEQRMMELLKKQEEERLMLEESFRQKTQELVALCAKSLTVEEENGNDSCSLMMTRTKTPDIHTASSVSQLSLCDVSYDSCTDTDDAAYQTCHANGTSEENVNNSEHTLTEETTTKHQDSNGNDIISLLLPQRMTEYQQTRAATTINAYVRGYLTRRLFKTDEVQNIKRTIADIVCFIVSTQQTTVKGTREDAKQAALRRNAGKQIAYCLDQLHTIFVTCTPRERLKMIRRDRILKSKSTLPKKDLELNV